PQDIVIQKIDTGSYFVPSEYKLEYEKYLKSDEAVKIKNRKDNSTRWMISNYETNFCKKNKKVYISLKKTDWLTLQFMWGKYKLSESKNKIISDIFINKRISPNSFCLHLVLLTKDEKIITTAISKEKLNDYPLTWAATIGEQIEKVDFSMGTEFDKNFVINWVSRALKEEFGIYEDQFERIVFSDGIRVLSVDVEGDIGNISLLTLVKMDVKFDEFIEESRKHPEIDKEFASIDYVEIKDVPEIMVQTNILNSKLHPSTFLRLQMTYLHIYGVNSFVMEYKKASKKRHKKVFFEKDIKD
ncbi:MAG: hypothetical protein KBT48_12415, partial [Firmicutes bacterium]|nr:hypothetical protein [Bacillota bacterium]